MNKLGAIKVDSYLRTEDKDVFAAGDCAAKVNFITREDTPIMLASTAASEARIAGMNLYNLSVVRSFTGNSCSILDCNWGYSICCCRYNRGRSEEKWV